MITDNDPTACSFYIIQATVREEQKESKQKVCKDEEFVPFTQAMYFYFLVVVTATMLFCKSWHLTFKELSYLYLTRYYQAGLGA